MTDYEKLANYKTIHWWQPK